MLNGFDLTEAHGYALADGGGNFDVGGGGAQNFGAFKCERGEIAQMVVSGRVDAGRRSQRLVSTWGKIRT